MQEQGSKRKELAFVFSIVSLPFDDLYLDLDLEFYTALSYMDNFLSL